MIILLVSDIYQQKTGFITQGNDNAIKMFIFEDNNVVTNQSHENDTTLTVHARLYKSYKVTKKTNFSQI